MKYYQDSVSDWSICYKDKTIVIDTVISETITRYPGGEFDIKIRFASGNGLNQYQTKHKNNNLIKMSFNSNYLIKRSFHTYDELFTIEKIGTESFTDAYINSVDTEIVSDDIYDSTMHITGRI